MAGRATRTSQSDESDWEGDMATQGHAGDRRPPLADCCRVPDGQCRSRLGRFLKLPDDPRIDSHFDGMV